MAEACPAWIADTFRLGISGIDYGPSARPMKKYQILGFGNGGEELDYFYMTDTDLQKVRGHLRHLKEQIEKHHACEIDTTPTEIKGEPCYTELDGLPEGKYYKRRVTRHHNYVRDRCEQRAFMNNSPRGGYDNYDR